MRQTFSLLYSAASRKQKELLLVCDLTEFQLTLTRSHAAAHSVAEVYGSLRQSFPGIYIRPMQASRPKS